jgi:hypothetical protein
MVPFEILLLVDFAVRTIQKTKFESLKLKSSHESSNTPHSGNESN